MEARSRPNRLRAHLFDAIQAEPGTHTRGLLARMGCGNGALDHHLRVLEKTGAVVRVDSGRYTRWYPNGGTPRAELERASALRAGRRGTLYSLVVTQPGLSQRELAHRLAVSEAAVHKSLVALERVRLLERRRDGRHSHVYPLHPLHVSVEAASVPSAAPWGPTVQVAT